MTTVITQTINDFNDLLNIHSYHIQQKTDLNLTPILQQYKSKIQQELKKINPTYQIKFTQQLPFYYFQLKPLEPEYPSYYLRITFIFDDDYKKQITVQAQNEKNFIEELMFINEFSTIEHLKYINIVYIHNNDRKQQKLYDVSQPLEEVTKIIKNFGVNI